jgi:hypothetical protein
LRDSLTQLQQAVREVNPTGFGFDEDSDWRGTRLELGHLLEALSKGNLIDASHDAIAGRCVVALLDDADPTQDDERRYGDGMGAVNYSINTVRGQAVHAAAGVLAALSEK